MQILDAEYQFPRTRGLADALVPIGISSSATGSEPLLEGEA